MEVFNRPPTVADDALHYALYPAPGRSDKAFVASLAACISVYVDERIPSFLWHRDPFELKVASREDVKEEYHLEGIMRVGDCVDDEWCTVWLLKQISAKWDLAVSVFDSDGEFLLIEAAYALPDWIAPSNAENRVWIYSSQIHIIPLTHISPPSRKPQRRRLPGKSDSDDEGTNEGDEAFISVENALSVLRDGSIDTLASPDVQNIIQKRINEYPGAAKNHVHSTKVYIPVDIARALSFDPTLVQKPVETFYTRDTTQLRAAHRMSRFPPDSSVLTVVTMTRTAYAQLLGQKFFPPKVFGQWKEREGTPEWRWRDVGMKIAVGFEMLYQESKGRINPTDLSSDSVQSSTDAKLEALRRNPQYISYIQNLISANYFRGELEGSELWKKLEEQAAEVFLNTFRDDDASRPTFAIRVSEAISRAANSVSSIQADEDSDDWLNIDAKDFENMLETTMGTSKPDDAMDVDSSAQDHLASEQASRLKDLATKVGAFVDGQGDLEGALFDDEELSDEELSNGMGSDSDSDSQDATEDPAQRQAAMDRLVPGLQASEYGQMPASFHKNSQKVARPTDAPEDKPAPTPTPTEPYTKPMREPMIPRDKYDGVDSDDETDSEEDVDEEEEEDQPQVVGDVEVDMGEEEDEFLEFSRQALGISDEQWGDILRDRKSRGAFVPPGVAIPAESSAGQKSSANGSTPMVAQGRQPEPGPRPNVNPNLDSFEAVMRAMDRELSSSRPSKSKTDAKDGKGKAKAAAVEEEEEEDIQSAMDRELRAALEGGQDSDDEGEEPMDYTLIKNFLESFNSQVGLAGPVSTLAGRLL
ncbi:SGT1-domain-containing protein [Mycena amicta]|nr:SGT1-domain-containing protein [Mycena amicta]